MPTYNAVGVTLTLTAADLQSTLTTTLEPRQGVSQQAASKRIDDAFEAGEQLPESPVSIHPDGSRIMDFIGTNNEFPMLMVESGSQLSRHWIHDFLRSSSQSSPHEEAAKIKSKSGSQWSSAVSVSSGVVGPLRNNSHSRSTRSRGTADTTVSFPFDHSNSSKSPSKQRSIPAKALRLKLEWSEKTFLSTSIGGRAKDMKFEIFINGIYAGVKYVTSRGYATDAEKFWCISGIRCHRQVEKPFIYVAVNEVESAGTTAEQRWNDIAGALQCHAHDRGRNQHDEAPPSGDYLIALSQLTLPASLAQNKTFGIIDVILTAGSGSKYGPETTYMTAPARMDDSAYSVVENTSPALSRSSRAISITSTPGVYPMAAMDTESTLRADSLLDPMDIDRLKPHHGLPVEDKVERLVVKLKLGNRLNTLPSTSPAKPASSSMPNLGHKPHIPQFGQPDLSQQRMNLAIEAGASMEGRLFSRVLSAEPGPPQARKLPLIPHLTPPMYSPPFSSTMETRSPKKRRRSSKAASSPVRRSVRYESETASVQNTQSVSAHKVNLQEATPEEALQAFRMPQSCVGSVLSLADGETFRQVGKERKGQFKEDSVIVGMRFLVV